MMDSITAINTFLWVIGNLTLGYIAFALIIFVIGYFILFNPKATTGGKLIYRFFLSLVGIVGLVFIGIFIDPVKDNGWRFLPQDIEWWRPLLRVSVYGFVAYTITSLAVLLGIRKWKPHLIKSKATRDLVKVRNDTTEIPVVKPE
jgi:hypothetical protein